MPELGSRFRFGSFELDSAFGELRKRGLRIHLEDQPVRGLAALVERSGAVLTRDELRTTVWPDGTYVDFDRSLNRAINKVRLALGDSAANPRFIETLPRRGYRFVAPVSGVDNGADSVSPVPQSNDVGQSAPPAGHPQETSLSPSSSQGGPTRLSRRSLVAGGGSLALAAMASYAFLGRQPIDSIAVLPFVNVGGDPDSEYLSEGISEALITSLSRLPGLKVLSRDTVFRYQAPGGDVRELRREFGVRGALTGTLTHQGDSLIVSAELVDTTNGAILWRNQYRRPVADIHARSADAILAEPCPPRVRRQAGLDDCVASERGRFRGVTAATAGDVAGCGPPPGDRCRAGLAAGSLGPIRGGPCGHTAGTGVARRWGSSH